MLREHNSPENRMENGISAKGSSPAALKGVFHKRKSDGFAALAVKRSRFLSASKTRCAQALLGRLRLFP